MREIELYKTDLRGIITGAYHEIRKIESDINSIDLFNRKNNLKINTYSGDYDKRITSISILHPMPLNEKIAEQFLSDEEWTFANLEKRNKYNIYLHSNQLDPDKFDINPDYQEKVSTLLERLGIDFNKSTIDTGITTVRKLFECIPKTDWFSIRTEYKIILQNKHKSEYEINNYTINGLTDKQLLMMEAVLDLQYGIKLPSSQWIVKHPRNINLQFRVPRKDKELPMGVDEAIAKHAGNLDRIVNGEKKKGFFSRFRRKK